MVGDKAVCERWRVCESACVTKMAGDKVVWDNVVCESWCVTKMLGDKVV